jgi:hypothetical protein
MVVVVGCSARKAPLANGLYGRVAGLRRPGGEILEAVFSGGWRAGGSEVVKVGERLRGESLFRLTTGLTAISNDTNRRMNGWVVVWQ